MTEDQCVIGIKLTLSGSAFGSGANKVMALGCAAAGPLLFCDV